MSDPLEQPWDEGHPNERTTLAWVRTALSLLGTGALVAKQSGEALPAMAILTLTLATTVVMILESERRHHRRGHALLQGDPVVAMHHLLITAGIVTALSAAGLATVAL